MRKLADALENVGVKLQRLEELRGRVREAIDTVYSAASEILEVLAEGPTAPNISNTPQTTAIKNPELDFADFGGAAYQKIKGKEREYGGVLDDFERAILCLALHDANGNKSGAANLLGISRSTFGYRIRSLGLESKIEDIVERPEATFGVQLGSDFLTTTDLTAKIGQDTDLASAVPKDLGSIDAITDTQSAARLLDVLLLFRPGLMTATQTT